MGADSIERAERSVGFEVEVGFAEVEALEKVTTRLLSTAAQWSNDVRRAKPNTVNVLGKYVFLFSIEYENADKLVFVDEQILKALNQLHEKVVKSPLYNLFRNVRKELAKEVTLGGTLLLARLASTVALVAEAKRTRDFFSLSELEKRGIVKKKRND